jgi:hypothetical protein
MGLASDISKGFQREKSIKITTMDKKFLCGQWMIFLRNLINNICRNLP